MNNNYDDILNLLDEIRKNQGGNITRELIENILNIQTAYLDQPEIAIRETKSFLNQYLNNHINAPS